MDLSKLTVILCTFLLAVCLVLAVSALTVLRNAVDETDRVRENAKELLEDLSYRLQQPSASGVDETESSVPVNASCDLFDLRESGGRIGAYTSDGILVRFFDVAVETLPEADRLALMQGISFSSWKELLAAVQDYSG